METQWDGAHQKRANTGQTKKSSIFSNLWHSFVLLRLEGGRLAELEDLPEYQRPATIDMDESDFNDVLAVDAYGTFADKVRIHVYCCTRANVCQGLLSNASEPHSIRSAIRTRTVKIQSRIGNKPNLDMVSSASSAIDYTTSPRTCSMKTDYLPSPPFNNSDKRILIRSDPQVTVPILYPNNGRHSCRLEHN